MSEPTQIWSANFTVRSVGEARNKAEALKAALGNLTSSLETGDELNMSYASSVVLTEPRTVKFKGWRCDTCGQVFRYKHGEQKARNCCEG